MAAFSRWITWDGSSAPALVLYPHCPQAPPPPAFLLPPLPYFSLLKTSVSSAVSGGICGSLSSFHTSVEADGADRRTQIGRRRTETRLERGDGRQIPD